MTERPLFFHLARPIAVAAAIALFVGCAEDTVIGPNGQPISVAGRTAVATPTPRVVATADVQPTPEVATPEPVARPTPPAVPTPSPTPVGAGGDPAASGVADELEKTGAPGDLAISGPAYFVLSTTAEPQGVEDLFFTRQGRFELAEDEGGAVPVYRLKHTETGFFAVSYTRVEAPANSAPQETEAASAAVVATTWAEAPAKAEGLALDAERNPQAAGKFGFDFTGRLRIDGKDPRAGDGKAQAVYLALAQFGEPDELVAQSGFKGLFKHKPAAGSVRLGVAVTGAGRLLGNANLLLTGTYEPVEGSAE